MYVRIIVATAQQEHLRELLYMEGRRQNIRKKNIEEQEQEEQEEGEEKEVAASYLQVTRSVTASWIVFL